VSIEDKIAGALRGESVAPSDQEVIAALEAVLGRKATAAEVGKLFATVEGVARVAVSVITDTCVR
jgi:hypothetical protein